jgi:hypothetical protein
VHQIFRPAQASLRRTRKRTLPHPPPHSRLSQRRHAIALEGPVPALDLPPRGGAPPIVHDDPETPGRLLAAAESEQRAKLQSHRTSWVHYSSQFHPITRVAGPVSELPGLTPQADKRWGEGSTPPPVPISANTGEYHRSLAAPHALREAQRLLQEGAAATPQVAANVASTSAPGPKALSPRGVAAARRASEGSAAMTASPMSSPPSSPRRPSHTSATQPLHRELESHSESNSASAAVYQYPAPHSGPPSSRGVIGATLGSWVQEGVPLPQRRSTAFSDERQPSSAGDISLDIMRAGLLAGADLQSIDSGPHYDAAAYGLPPPPHLRSPTAPAPPDGPPHGAPPELAAAAATPRPLPEESPARSASTFTAASPSGTSPKQRRESASGTSTATATSAASPLGRVFSGTSGVGLPQPGQAVRQPGESELVSPQSAKSDIMALALGAILRLCHARIIVLVCHNIECDLGGIVALPGFS